MAWFEEMKPKERQKVSDKLSYTFRSLDKDKNGIISPTELRKLFKQISGFQKWRDDDFDGLFSNADWNCDSELSFEEFVDWILEIDIPQLTGRGRKHYPIYRSREIMYPNGVTVPLQAVMDDLQGYQDQMVREGTPPVAAKLRKFMTTRGYNKTLHRFFVDADASGNGVLSWNDREIYNFGLLCLDRLGLPGMGGDSVFHNLYLLFDLNKSQTLDERECLYMMDSMFRALACLQRASDPEDSSEEEDY
jgi:hypothetical protein